MRLPIPKRQKTAAVQDAARSGKRLGSSPVLECASPLALFVGLTTGLEITGNITAPLRASLQDIKREDFGQGGS
jgi:hypothetical protein